MLHRLWLRLARWAVPDRALRVNWSHRSPFARYGYRRRNWETRLW